MAPAPRYLTLRDYVRVLRRYSLAVVLIALVGAGAGYVDAKRQKPVYKAKATLSLEDPIQALGIVGLAPNGILPPATIAEQTAQTMTRPSVMMQVQHKLGTSRSLGALSSAVSGQVSQTSGLLDVTATATDPAFAARLANVTAQVLVNQANATAQSRFASVTNAARRQIAALKSSGSNSGTTASQLTFYEGELGRLQTVSQFARTDYVVQGASRPTSPSSPNTLRSTLIGLTLGLLLAVAVAFVRDSFDRRLRSAGDLESYFRLPVLGYVRDRTMGKLPHAANGNGKEQKLDLEAFRILRRNLEFLNLDSPPRAVVVTSAVPEEGKTTVAGSLACAMAAAGKQTLLVDCDLRRPALAERLGVEQTPGISDFLSGDATAQEILRTVEFGEEPGANGAGAVQPGSRVRNYTLVLIPAGSPTSFAAELLGSGRFKAFLEQVSEAYDAVVIDSSPLLPVADTLEMLPNVDGIIVCARARRTTHDEAAAVKTALSRVPERPTGLVLTGIKEHESEAYVYSYSYA